MGNCQAAEAATVVIQHRGGKTERVYWSVGASQVMAANPGHYVALVITTLPSSSATASSLSSRSSSSSWRSSSSSSRSSSTTAVKHLKLIRPDDTLRIGHVYRLVSFEEVLREFASKRHVKLSRLLVKHKEKPASRRSSSSSSSSSRCTDDSGNDSSNSRESKDCSSDGYRDKLRSRYQVNEPESSPATDQTVEPSTEPSTEKEAEETDQEPELVVRGMIGGGGMTAMLRRGQWRPTLHSIAEEVAS